MVKKSGKNTFLLILATLTFFATLSLHFSRFSRRPPATTFLRPPLLNLSPPPSIPPALPSPVAVLIPDWEVLVIVPPETLLVPPLENNYLCLYPDKTSTPANFTGSLPFNGGSAFKCAFPGRQRRRLPFLQPVLVRTEERDDLLIRPLPPAKHLLRWNFIVYDSFTTEDDVVLFVKGVNNRQGVNRPPSDFRCVFGHDSLTPVTTPVTSSTQEVFRCPRPRITGSRPISVTIEILENTETHQRAAIIPSLARYVPDTQRTIMQSEPKSLICACTMVYNVGKFLKEWVMFHSKSGVQKFILYDNDSNDDLGAQVESLRNDGYDVRTVYWVWPKAQEAGFSHCALYSARICDWAAYVDVDEFFLKPSWLDDPAPRPGDDALLSSLLSRDPELERVGQVSVKCYEFGPSENRVHPTEGVTQGYTCRRRIEQRHKSLVYLPAVHHSLLNVVHHFKVKDGYTTRQVGTNQAIVNHYKYQAWPEFVTKFRRRVSGFVIDWRQKSNPKSNDRAPGLGYDGIEPHDWSHWYCDVRDERMKELTKKWFGVKESSTMAWQSAK